MFCLKHNVRQHPAIEFLNIKPNEPFNYSIVLIKGVISNYNHRHGVTSLRITNENIRNVNENAEITNDGAFKVAVKLAPGVNRLQFHYCCITKEIPLEFINGRNNAKYLLKIVYIVCQNHDGRFQVDAKTTDNSIEVACEKINLAIEMVQCIYAEMLSKHGFTRKSFEFVECQPFQSSLTVDEARLWDQNRLWNYHATELLSQETDTQHNYKYFGILASTLCENGAVKANAALGIGDVALFGSGTLYAWPSTFDTIQRCFEDATIVDTKQLIDDSNGRNTFGGCYATALGSICHEIGHIFDLGHTSDGIMGNDIDYVNRLFVIEKCPRELPRRIASNCSNSKNLDSNEPTNRRLTAVRKTNAILTKYHSRRNDDLTFLTENCAIILNFHNWFNQFDRVDSQIRCDLNHKIIVSSIPLALIEFRSPENGMCMKYYRFDNDTTNDQHKFTVPADAIEQNYDLIAIDSHGNIMKCATNDFR